MDVEIIDDTHIPTKEKSPKLGEISSRSCLEHFYQNARTYFSKPKQETSVPWKKEYNLQNQNHNKNLQRERVN